MIPLRAEGLGVTDTGLVREINEDRFLASDAAGLWAVADGMGGLSRGDRAAAAVTASLAALPNGGDLEAAVANAAAAVQAAGAAIHAEAAAHDVRMGTTLVAMLVRDRRFAVLWCGDSRAYLLRDHCLHRLTRDHSQVQQLIDAGLVQPHEAEVHPLRHVLTRAVGTEPAAQLDMVSDVLRPGDLFLLCSDGLHGLVTDAELMTALVRPDLSAAAAELVALCRTRGAPDNITLVTVLVHEPTLLQIGQLAEAPGR